MRLTTPIAALALVAVIISYSITMACGATHESASDSCSHNVTVTTTATCSATIDATLTELARVSESAVEQTRVERSYTLVKASVRAGLNLTRVLYRAAAHRAVDVARTLYHTATAMS